MITRVSQARWMPLSETGFSTLWQPSIHNRSIPDTMGSWLAAKIGLTECNSKYLYTSHCLSRLGLKGFDAFPGDRLRVASPLELSDGLGGLNNYGFRVDGPKWTIHSILNRFFPPDRGSLLDKPALYVGREMKIGNTFGGPWGMIINWVAVREKLGF